MTAKDQDITITERESKTIDPSPLTDSDGNAVNLQAATLKWVVFDESDDSIIISKDTDGDISIVNETEGEWNIDLSPSDTDGEGGNYYEHEGRVIDQQGLESVVTRGKFIIEESKTE